jgi:dihydroorotate dehydrogenase
MDPEKAHYITMWCLMTFLKVPGAKSLMKVLLAYHKKPLARQVAGIHFSNPVGLAAGFDKNGLYLDAMATLGFSHIEVGTITPRPQPGNPKPRLFRLVRSRALINRMGFNNDGVDVLARRLSKKRPEGLIVGANIGKNKDTPLEEATSDYLISFKKLYSLVDYFTVNVSSPNTPGLRSLQEKEPLTNLLSTLQFNNPDARPVFLKIAPDLTEHQLDEIIEIVLDTKLAGVIATNTTITRNNLVETAAEIESIGAGGLSGKPVVDMSVAVVRYLKEKGAGKFSIIGVGGIEDIRSAQKHFDAGADLIQVYSGLIYTGPALVKKILKGLV